MSPLVILAQLLTVVGFIGGLLYFGRQGGPTGAKAVIDIKNEQIAAYEVREKEHRAEMLEMRDRLTKIETQLKAKDAELERLTAIFQNRDPQSAQITNQAANYMQASMPILTAIADKLGVSIPLTSKA